MPDGLLSITDDQKIFWRVYISNFIEYFGIGLSTRECKKYEAHNNYQQADKHRSKQFLLPSPSITLPSPGFLLNMNNTKSILKLSSRLMMYVVIFIIKLSIKSDVKQFDNDISMYLYVVIKAWILQFYQTMNNNFLILIQNKFVNILRWWDFPVIWRRRNRLMWSLFNLTETATNFRKETLCHLLLPFRMHAIYILWYESIHTGPKVHLMHLHCPYIFSMIWCDNCIGNVWIKKEGKTEYMHNQWNSEKNAAILGSVLRYVNNI